MGILKALEAAFWPIEKPGENIIFKKLEDAIGYSFTNKDLLREALTHPSFDPRKNIQRHNQRLEFLGDSVVGCILAKWLFQKFPEKTEGELSRYKSLLARGHNLAAVARVINLQNYLILGKSEQKSRGNFRQAVLEDAFEAVLGAIYLDSDYQTAERVMLQWQEKFLEVLNDKNASFNPKGKLQEYLQAKSSKPKVSYRLIKQSGPDHRKVFHVQVFIDDNALADGHGQSKKVAEENAAEAAYKKLISETGEKD